jgi:hypothetical protein
MSALLAFVGSYALQQQEALLLSGTELLGICGGLGLAVLHATQFMVFEHPVLFSVAFPLLVLCSALLMTAGGVVLLRQRSAGLQAAERQRASLSPKGDR